MILHPVCSLLVLGLAFASGFLFILTRCSVEDSINTNDLAENTIMMKALVATKKSPDYSAFEINEVPKPSVADTNRLLIKVTACSLNPVDFKIASGYLGPLSPSFPHRVGFDVAGVIEEIGSKVDNKEKWQVGQKIMVDLAETQGALAEYASVDPSHASLQPSNLNDLESVGIPLAGLTSYQCLVDYGQLKSGQNVLILGTSGGTGYLAVQIAKALGAHVSGTCSTRNVDFVKSLGIDRVIDYKTSNWWETVEANSIDLVYDTVGGPDHDYDKAVKVLKNKTGRYVTIAGATPNAGKGVTVGALASFVAKTTLRKINSLFGANSYTFMLTNSKRGDQLTILKDMVEQGKIKVRVDKVFDFYTEYKQAYEYIAAGKTVGKIAIRVADDENAANTPSNKDEKEEEEANHIEEAKED